MIDQRMNGFSSICHKANNQLGAFLSWFSVMLWHQGGQGEKEETPQIINYRKTSYINIGDTISHLHRTYSIQSTSVSTSIATLTRFPLLPQQNSKPSTKLQYQQRMCNQAYILRGSYKWDGIAQTLALIPCANKQICDSNHTQRLRKSTI